jgi:outer membrane protein W
MGLRSRQLAAAGLVLALVPAAAPCEVPSPLTRADLTVSVGSFSASLPDRDAYDRWAHSAVGTLGAGYFWTDHLKTEAELAWTGERRTYSTVFAAYPYSTVYARQTLRSLVASAAQIYQFRRNAWVHPYVGAGIDLERQWIEAERAPQVVYPPRTGGPIRVVPAELRRGTRTEARPFGAAGLKLYVSERVFVRTELKIGARRGLDRIVWKAGLGVDVPRRVP